MVACHIGDFDKLCILRSTKVDLKIPNEHGWTALHGACRYSMYSCICLITSGLITLFLILYSNGHLEIVKYLIEEGECDICLSCKDKNNQTPMQLACQ